MTHQDQQIIATRGAEYSSAKGQHHQSHHRIIPRGLRYASRVFLMLMYSHARVVYNTRLYTAQTTAVSGTYSTSTYMSSGVLGTSII